MKDTKRAVRRHHRSRIIEKYREYWWFFHYTDKQRQNNEVLRQLRYPERYSKDCKLSYTEEDFYKARAYWSKTTPCCSCKLCKYEKEYNVPTYQDKKLQDKFLHDLNYNEEDTE